MFWASDLELEVADSLIYIAETEPSIDYTLRNSFINHFGNSFVGFPVQATSGPSSNSELLCTSNSESHDDIDVLDIVDEDSRDIYFEWFTQSVLLNIPDFPYIQKPRSYTFKVSGNGFRNYLEENPEFVDVVPILRVEKRGIHRKSIKRRSSCEAD
jgi:hypothetical protein